MKRVPIILLFIAFAILISVHITYEETSNNFISVRLPKGVTIDVPQNWVALTSNQRITLDTAVESELDLSGSKHETSDLPFAANYYDDYDNTIGILNIRYYPNLDLTQEDARNATNQDIQELDAALKENILKGAEATGMKISTWGGTKKVNINRITAFVTEYNRVSFKGSGNFRVKLIRVLAGDRSFTLTVSYLDSASFVLSPITDRIINSLKLAGVDSSASHTDPKTVRENQSVLSVMADLYGDQWWLVLLVSGLLTWGIGLTPPLLIRFAILRRPIKSKGWTVGIVALFWFINFTIFTAMSSTSKSHIGVALIAFVSYAILRKGAKKQKLQSNLKLCPSCHAFQDASKQQCPNCGYDLTNVELHHRGTNQLQHVRDRDID